MDSDLYPDWLPTRPLHPPPQSTIQSYDEDDSPISGRKPTPRSVRIVNLDTDHQFHAPPKVKVISRPDAPPLLPQHHLPLPLPQPRFNAKNLHIQLLRNPSTLMKAYFYIWPLLVFYHIPLQSFFDFNAVYILLQVTKYPSPGSSSRSWALGTTAYIACWLAWILIVLLTYEIIYSFARRWRLRRPLILPIYLSSPAFNLAALTSYSTFSFLQHIRLSALSHEHADAISYSYSKVHSRSDSQDDVPDPLPTTTTTPSLSQFFAESAYLYSQNLPTVGLLLPRATLSLALLLSFSTPSATSGRDTTFFNKEDGSLSDYAKGVLLANAAWTAWRTLVLLISWLGLWLFSSNRLAGLCGPRHIWEEQSQEKSRSVYSSAASEHGARNSWLYNHHHQPRTVHASYDGYVGDELPWEWREHTRMRIQDAFEFCLASDVHRSRSDGLVWSSGYHQRKRSAKGKERSSGDEDEKDEGRTKRGGFEGIEKVLAAVGLGAPSSPSGARRGALTRDLFDTPEPDENLVLSMASVEAGPSVLPLKTPKIAKRNSKDKDTIQNVVLLPPVPQIVAPGAPLLSLPYPFTQNGVGRVGSREGVPFPAVGAERQSLGSGTSSSSSGTGSGSGTTETGEDDDDDEEEDDEEDPTSNRGSESMSSLGQPISPSRGYPILGGTRGRAHGHGHTRNPSGVSSVGQSISRTQGRRSISSGATGTGTGTGTGSFSGGGYSYRYSYSASSGGGVKSQESEMSGGRRRDGSRSTGNRSTTSEERSISVSGSEGGAGGIPMPPRHPNLQVGGSQGQGQGQVRTRKVAISAPSSSASSASGSVARLSVAIPAVVHRGSPVVFPSAAMRERTDSGRVVGGGIGSDVEGRYEDQGGFEGYEWAGAEGGGEGEDEVGERDDRLGLLGVPSPRASMVSVGGGNGGATGGNGNGTGGGGRSRTHSFHSFISSASSSSRSRTRTHSTQSGSGSASGGGGGGSPSVRERASSVGNSVRSIVAAAASSGLGLGLGLQRSRVNSSMARLEEEREDAGVGVGVGEFGERMGGYASTASHSRSGSESVSGGENHTFGRPVVFMRGDRMPGKEERVDEEGEGDVVLMERTSRLVSRGEGSAEEEEMEMEHVPEVVVPGVEEEQSGEEDEADHEQYQLRQGIDIPTSGRDRTFTTMISDSNTSHPDISTAPGSFVTAPPSFSLEGGSTGGSETHGEVLGRVGGGEDGFVGGQTWRVV